MRHKITPAVTLVNKIPYNLYIIECHRCQPIQKIIVVATNIDHFCSLLFHHLHDNFEKIRMLCLPLPGAAFAQGPAVDNVTIQYQSPAVDGFQEVAYFNSF